MGLLIFHDVPKHLEGGRHAGTADRPIQHPDTFFFQLSVEPHCCETFTMWFGKIEEKKKNFPWKGQLETWISFLDAGMGFPKHFRAHVVIKHME